MFNKLLQNARKPVGAIGRFLVGTMNGGHAGVHKWGMGFISPKPDWCSLDIGCGGGSNIAYLLRTCPEGRVHGIDYSEASVAVSKKKNAAELGKRCKIVQGSVSSLPYKSGIFDLVTAFETVYFWPDIERDFAEVARVLKQGGRFLVCNELNDPNNTTWTKRIDGMRLYSNADIKALLEGAGFEIESEGSHASRMCVVGVKK